MTQKIEPDIDELAMKHMLRHPNDKSDAILAKMRRRFGSAETLKALIRARGILELMSPPEPTPPDTLLDPWHVDWKYHSPKIRHPKSVVTITGVAP